MKKTAIHPAIKEDHEFIASLADLARQFLIEKGIEIGGYQYCADLEALDKGNEYEFAKALMFEKNMFPNEDFPEGMTEQDINPKYLERYPFIAAAGVINISEQFKELASRISTQNNITIVHCHNYALFYWRIIWLAEALKISDMFKMQFNRHQKEVASKPRPNGLNRLITDILQQHHHYTAKQVLKELTKLKGAGIIIDVTDDAIVWKKDDGNEETTSISGLKDRVSRIKNS